MNKIARFLLFSVITGFFLWAGCLKQENYPDVPAIAFEGFVSVYDTGHFPVEGILTISFTDGNGDIGLNEGDTLPPYDKAGLYYYNFVIDYYEKQYGQFVKLNLDPPLSSRIPVLSPLYPGKPIKGTITDSLLLNPAPVFDTIRIEAFIYDRALNKSNVISTPVIILRRP